MTRAFPPWPAAAIVQAEQFAYLTRHDVVDTDLTRDGHATVVDPTT